MCFPLRGRFKGEKGERNHMLVCAYEIKSGLRVGQWIERFLSCFKEMGRSETGFLFVDSAKKVRKIGAYVPQFIERLLFVGSFAETRIHHAGESKKDP